MAERPSWALRRISEPRAQYDHHVQLIFRLRDQDGRAVEHHDIFLDSVQSQRDPSLPIRELFEDKHRNRIDPNVITFYLRTDAFSAESQSWVPRVPSVQRCYLEISATEPQTDDILHLPLRFEFTPDQLNQWSRGHGTTVVDVELLRLPSPEVFKMVSG